MTKSDCKYLMEGDEESIRLDLKTDPHLVEEQALWAGLKPGMRIADLGCGSGKTTYYLHQLAQPQGETVGVDFSKQRVRFARSKYTADGLSFKCLDIRNPLSELEAFDFIWIRFVLEYYRTDSFRILENIFQALKPGGILCLIDLDHNCLNHYSIPLRLEKALQGVMASLEKKANFDPYAGRKLYSYLYDLGCAEIGVNLQAHHLIFGKLRETDEFNWRKKVEIAAKNSGYRFSEYDGGYKEFHEEFMLFFNNEKRFTYTPLIACRGRKH
jgi:SAM-dependent methyltransferase